jgi:hypothetical protein
MTSPEENAYAQRQQKRALFLYRVLSGDLEATLHKFGAVLLGFSVKCGDEDYLLTMRADFEGEKMVAWVGATSLANMFRKAYREARSNTLRWKVDEWAEKQV